MDGEGAVLDEAEGVVTVPSPYPVEGTVTRLQELLAQRGIELFALVDHSGAAARAGLRMPDTKLLIFGSPRAGTHLMLASPSSALDLPAKILVAERPGSGTLVSYNLPRYLANRHHLSPELLGPLNAVADLVAEVTGRTAEPH